MRNKSLLSRLLLACLAFIVVQHVESSHGLAFKKVHHSDLVSRAFGDVVSPQAVQSLKRASVIGDEKAWETSAAHYDNCAWYEGRAWVQQHRLKATLAALRYAQSGAAADKQAVFDNLGFVLHATQDFYAHSNWVETHAWGQLANLEGAKPAGWLSGTFPDDEPKRCPQGSPSHDELNKDASGRRGFEEARFDATLAMQQQLALFRANVSVADPERGDETLLRLGLSMAREKQERIARSVRDLSNLADLK